MDQTTLTSMCLSKIQCIYTMPNMMEISQVVCTPGISLTDEWIWRSYVILF
jgi:hypothetical protein